MAHRSIVARIVVSISVVAALGCGAPAPSPATRRSAQTARELGRLPRQHALAWNAHRPDAFAALFTPDATLVTPSGTRAEGRSALLEVFARPSPTSESSSTTRIEAHQWLADDLLLIDAVQTVEGPGDERGEARLVAVVRREGDGWRFVAARPYVAAGR